MGKFHWRPTFKCIYVISEIHGNINSLNTILSSILPLRKNNGNQDIIVFLGNYIDKREESNKVIEKLIQVKNEYKERIVLLKGFHEFLFLKSMEPNGDDAYKTWLLNGGMETMKGYLLAARCQEDVLALSPSRARSYVPKEHIDFLKENLVNSYELEEYFFFNSGFDHTKTIKENHPDIFCTDNRSAIYLKKCIANRIAPKFLDDYIFIGNLNPNGKKPIIHSKYFMLGCGAPNQVLLFELNSTEARLVRDGNKKMYTHKFKIYE